MSEPVLLVEKNRAVATVTLNRPEKLNAFNNALKETMRKTVGQLNDDDEVKIVVLKGAGRAFSAGADLSGEPADPISFHLDADYKPFLTGISMSDKIWIAQVHGPAAGAAAALAMNCDLVVMADDAYIYMAFAAISLIPDAGNTKLLLQHLGYHRALEAVLEGRKITAQECLQFGIANKVTTAEELETTTQQWAEMLASSAPLALAASKRLLRNVGAMSFGDAISVEGVEQTSLLKSSDFKEGVSAFFEKRKPAWKGC
ncbi:enoyl-CoA hydratase-related protein [Alphaproteobacteria bacterium]|nr:enoyl-CoA hydratase-related protein [Alphaproteobacteria bacterium]